MSYLKKCFTFLICTVIVMTCTVVLITKISRQIIITELLQDVIRNPCTSQLQSVALDLSMALHLRRDRHESRRRTEHALKQVHRMIRQHHEITAQLSACNTKERTKDRREGALLDVCPEKYMALSKEHVLTNCTNSRPFEDVLSILLNGFDYDETNQVTVVLREINAIYPRLTVHLALGKRLVVPSDVTVDVIQHVLSKTATTGYVWNELVKMASTDYVLVGRRMEHFPLTGRLERMVRVVSELGVDIVGGALRAPNGHWSMGCQQTSLRNYTLAYVAGYYMSAASCAYCDYIPSPFVTRTSTLRAFNLEYTPRLAVFHDYFLRVREVGKLVVSCPDVMFYVQNDDAVSPSRRHDEWTHVARRLRLNRVKFPDGTRLSYSCKEADITCTWTAGVIVPICCLESLVKAINDIMGMCTKIGMYCSTNCGTTLGAVKFSGVLPWELDADIAYVPKRNASLWWQRHQFEKLGYTLEIVYAKLCPKYDPENVYCEAFVLRCPGGWGIDIYSSSGANIAESHLVQDPRLTPTKVLIVGQWINSHNNPGLYARNQYGYEILRHSEHWIVKHIPSTQRLDGGQFERCPSPGSHFCLDEYIADGNIDLMHP